MKRNDGLVHYAKTVGRVGLFILIGMVMLSLGFQFKIPTPGTLVLWLLPVSQPDQWGPDIPRYCAAVLVNAISAYLLIRGLPVLIGRLRQK